MAAQPPLVSAASLLSRRRGSGLELVPAALASWEPRRLAPAGQLSGVLAVGARGGRERGRGGEGALARGGCARFGCTCARVQRARREHRMLAGFVPARRSGLRLKGDPTHAPPAASERQSRRGDASYPEFLKEKCSLGKG
ncbi:unnamed protein product [Rangifer tarandus platyrhynchus]|uniref:Uncharacterized protein n=3 Tax=Rangifer tarandus platyrhynchus TaxID=3082113 RepID=A0AC59Z808_RANTA|nr:unnamed protein product [Rangifer tarandus platyrhynchus]CAI9694229.1 unnamed protein product [Rangifer tarandus platyrhynchus]